MKPKYCLIWLLSAALVGCGGSSVARPDTITNTNAEWENCREFTNGALGKCTTNLRAISSNYVVKRGKVYWMTISEFYERPCLLGMGALFPNLTSWKCIKSETNQPYIVEERRLDRVARYSPAFQSLEGSEPLRADWQQEQLANYAKDEKSVYYKGKKIEGADPQKFSVIFPFGKNERWKKFSLSQSARTLFFRWKATEYVELNQFRVFTPVRCPEHGLSSCTAPREIDRFFESGNWGGILGWIGDDIVFLKETGVTRFAGMASTDMFMFATRYRIYLYTHNKFYELSKDHKLIEMDVGYFERNNY